MSDSDEGIENRLKVNRELGFDRGVSVVCSLLLQHGSLELNRLAIEYVKHLMATPLGEKLASMDYEHREQIIRALDPHKGAPRDDSRTENVA